MAAPGGWVYSTTDQRDGEIVFPETAIELFERLNALANSRPPSERERRALDKAYRDALDEFRALQRPAKPKPKPPKPLPRVPQAPPTEAKPVVPDSPREQRAPDVREPGPVDDRVTVDRQVSEAPHPRKTCGERYWSQSSTMSCEDAVAASHPPPVSEAERADLRRRVEHNEPTEPGEPHPSHAELYSHSPVDDADPVDLFTGAFCLSTTDLEVPGAVGSLRFERHYRSGRPYFGPFGYGWDHGYNVYARRLNDGRIALWTGRLREVACTPSGGEWFSDELSAVVRPLPAPGDGLEVTFSHGLRWRLERPPGWGDAERIPLAAVTDRHGNAVSLMYDASDRIESALDAWGRGLLFRYGRCGLLEGVSDHTRTREVRYEHADEIEHLARVVLPATAEFPKGIATAYDYDEHASHPAMRHNIVRVWDARDRVYLENEYAGPEAGWAFNTVTRQTTGDFAYDFAYEQIQWVAQDPAFLDDIATRTSVYPPDGSLHVYTFNYRGDVLDHRFRLDADRSHRVIAAQWRYDAVGNVTEAVAPDGVRTLFAYDSANPNPCARRNLREVRLAAPLPGAQPSRLIMRAEHDPEYQLPLRITDERGATTVATYDFDVGKVGATGLLTQVRLPPASPGDAGPPQEAVVRIEHNARGQVTSLRSPTGTRNEMGYHTGGLHDGMLRAVVRDVAGLAATTETGYDPRGFAAWAVEPGGGRTDFTTNDTGQVEEFLLPEVDGDRPRVRRWYGESGATVREEHPCGAYTDPDPAVHVLVDRFEEDVLGRVVLAETAANTARPRRARAIHDHAGRPVATWDALGTRTNHSYDERGLPLRTISAVGTPAAATATCSYDRAGRLVRRTDAVGRTTAVERDAWGRPVVVRHPGGAVEALRWAPGDLLVERTVTGIPAPGEPARLLARETTDYDERGRRRTQTVWSFADDPDAAVELTTRFRHDAEDRLVELRTPRGGVLRFSYDGLGNPTVSADAVGNMAERRYDAAGNVVESLVREREGPDVRIRVDRYTYDARNRLRTAASATGTTAFTYDGRDRLTARVEPGGVRVEFEAGPHGELDTLVVAPAGPAITWAYAYDAGGNLVSATDPTGETTHWTRDALGRAVDLTCPGLGTWTHRYDALGRVLEQTAPSGARVAYEYASAATGPTRMTATGAAGVADVPPHEFTYDPLDRLIRAENGLGLIERRHDSLGRVVSEASMGATVATAYTDDAGTEEVTYPDGRRERSVRDVGGRITDIELTAPGALGGSAGDVLARFFYAGRERPSRCLYGNGARDTYLYDDATRLTGVEVVADGAPVETVRTWHDARGRRAVTGFGAVPAANTRHRFDAGDRLTEARWGFPVPTGLPPAAPADQADAAAAFDAAASGAAPGQTYELTDADDRVRRVRHGEGTDDYTVAAGHRVVAAGGEAIAYHADGARARDGRYTYEVDALGRTTAIRSADGGEAVAEFRYDALSRVATGTLAAAPFTRWFAGGRPLQENDGATGAVRQWTPHPVWPLPLSVRDAEGERFVHSDGTSTTLCTTDEEGAVRERWRHGPFGEVRTLDASGADTVPAPGAPSWWRGMPELPGLGLYAPPERLYDPGTGVFLGRDPGLYDDSPSPYAFAGHNPVDHADPTGREKMSVSPPPQPPPPPPEPDWTMQMDTLPEDFEHPLFPYVQPIDTGFRPTNALVNRVLAPWSNLFWWSLNLVADRSEKLDRMMRRSMFSMEWDALATMGPMFKTMGIANEIPGGIRALTRWTAAMSAERPDILRSLGMVGVGVGIGGPVPRAAGPARRFMNVSLRIILEDAEHPLGFLVDRATGTWRARSHLSEEPAVQAGHLFTRWLAVLLGDVERFGVEDALLNQLTNWIGESGRRAAWIKEAVEVEGVVVEVESLKRWAAEYPELAKYLNGARVAGWSVTGQ